MSYKIQLNPKYFGGPDLTSVASVTYANQQTFYGKQIDLLDPLPEVHNFLEDPEVTCYRVSGMVVIQNGVAYVYNTLDQAIAAAEELEMDYDNYYYLYLPFSSGVRYFPTEGLASVYKWMEDTYQEDRCVGHFEYPEWEYVFYDGPLKGKQMTRLEWNQLPECEVKPSYLLAPNDLKIDYRNDDMVYEYLQGLSEDPEEVHPLPFIYLHGELEESNLEYYSKEADSCAPDLAMANMSVDSIIEIAKKQEGVTDIDQEGLTAELECHAKGEPALCVVSYDVSNKVLHGRVAWVRDRQGLAHAKDIPSWR